MISSKSYLIEAIRKWLVDSELTPFVTMTTLVPGAHIPPQFVDDVEVIFDVSPSATNQFKIDPTGITFQAKFSRVIHDIFIPIHGVTAICAKENGRGLVFDLDDAEDEGGQGEGESVLKPKVKSHLSLVKG